MHAHVCIANALIRTNCLHELHTHTHNHTCACMYTCACTHIHMYSQIHITTHIHMHMHTQAHKQSYEHPKVCCSNTLFFNSVYARLLTCKYSIYTSTVHCPVQGTGTSRSGPGLNMCWLIKDRLRRNYKAQLPPPTFPQNGYVLRTDLHEIACLH